MHLSKKFLIGIFLGENDWLEGDFKFPWHISIADEEIIDDSLNLLVIPQYGRNTNHTG